MPHLFVKIQAKVLVYLGQFVGHRSGQHSQGQVHHLQVLAPGGGTDLAGARSGRGGGKKFTKLGSY